MGRVGDPTIGLQLLLATTYDEALPLARRLEAENDARRRLEEEVAEEARQDGERTLRSGARTTASWCTARAGTRA